MQQKDKPEIIMVVDGDSDQTLAERISMNYAAATYVQSEKGPVHQLNHIFLLHSSFSACIL
jgi:hypothetical protein